MTRRTSLEEQAAFLTRRKAELGLVGRDYVPVNAGGRRTPSKQALLRKLRELAENKRLPLPFKANI